MEKYFVASFTDEPEKIFFSKEEAFKNQYTYIDAFDENGNKVTSYKFVGNEYTKDF